MEELVSFRKELEKAIGLEDYTLALDVMKQLGNAEMTVAALQTTGIGLVAGRLKKHTHEPIASAASALVNKWKGLLKPKPDTPAASASSSSASSVSSVSSSAAASPASAAASTSSSSDGVTATPEVVKSSPKPVTVKQGSNGILTEAKLSVSTHTVGDAKKITPSGSPFTPPLSVTFGPASPTPTAATKPAAKGASADSDVREKVRCALAEVLSTATIPKSDDFDISALPTPEAIATDIEASMFDTFGDKNDSLKQYKAKFRSLLFNLKNEKNPQLRTSVRLCEITSQALCRMTPQDLASPEMKEWRKKNDEWHKLAAQRGGGQDMYTTDMFRCNRCGERKTTYYQLQTRSADEPMTTYVTCMVCKNRWKFC